MRNINLLLGVAGLGLLCGCANQPTKFERKFFNIQTNMVGRVAVVTNVVPVYVTNSSVAWQTNLESGTPVALPISNATVTVSYKTNRAVATNLVEEYTFTPNANTALTSVLAGRTVGAFGPFGELAMVLVTAAFGVWAQVRTARAKKVAAVLAQVIETGRIVLQSTPQGQVLDDQWKLWMVKHQAEQGVISDVVRLLGSVVDGDSAREAADKLLALMHERRGVES
jgi:hypothetical protein